MATDKSTTIQLLYNVPLDKSQTHIVYFSGPTAQRSAFNSFVNFSFYNQSYVRPFDGVAWVEGVADDLNLCNYIAFQNSSYDSRWWYGFVDSVEYKGDNTAKVNFTLDPFQCYLLGSDYVLKESFVVREHAASDNIGENLIPENVELGEYVFEGLDVTNELSNCGVLVCSTVNPTDNSQESEGGNYNGVFSGVGYYFYENYSTAAAVLSSMSKPEAVLSVSMFPKAFLSYTGAEVTKNLGLKTINYTANKNTTNIGGYTPRNKKLFTYPYNFLYCTNFNGNSAEFKYEYFTTSNCDFRIAVDVTPNPTAFCVPLSYKGISVNYNEKLTLSGWPQCAWSSDVFKAYLAQNSSNVAVSMLSSALGTTAAAVSGNALGVGQGLLGIAGQMAQLQAIDARPRQSHGSPGTNINLAAGTLEFGFSQCHCQEQFLACIDDYFDVEGYATKRVKVPNTTVRPHWCYTKTIGCNAVGQDVPANMMEQIISVFDRGVTVWKSLADVGNYSLDNRV